MDLYEELMGLLTAIEAEGREYRLVGALALAVHGVPLATTDIDLLVQPLDVDAILAVARARGFVHEALPVTFRDGTEVRRVAKVVGGETLTLDLLLANDDLAHAWNSGETVETEEGRVMVVSREALIRMKVRSGRTRDLADVERLLEMDR